MTTSSQPSGGEHGPWRPRRLLAIVAGSLALGACASPAPKNESLPRISVDIAGRAASPTRDAGALVLADALVTAAPMPSVSADAAVTPIRGDARLASHLPLAAKNSSGYSFFELNHLTQRNVADGDASASEAKFRIQVLAAKQHNRRAGVMRSLKNGAAPNVNIRGGWPLIAVIAGYSPQAQPSVMGRPTTRESPKQVAYRFQILQFLINNGVNIDQPGLVGQTPLMAASGTAQLRLVRFLLRKGAHTGSTDLEGRNVIFYPAGMFHPVKLKIMNLLVAAAADVNHRARGGITALMDAAYRDDKLMAKRLLLLGADLSLVDEEGRTAVHIATQRGHHGLVKYLGTASL